jgi:aminoglycoside phosphotransferase (APT) family kinase protein
VRPDDTLPTSILASLGVIPDAVSRLGNGLASEAWKVEAGGAVSVLRISSWAPDEATTYRSEHAVMARLTAVGAPVPAPVTGDWRHPEAGWPPFSLTTFLAGSPMRPDATAEVAGPIAGFLRELHAVEVRGYGPLVQADEALGGSEDPIAGLRERWSGLHAWLVDDIDLGFHPAWRGHRDLLAAIGKEAGAALDAALAGPTVLVHSDLHEENILEDRDHLGFIDFGETFRGAAAWEFASIAYFLGWPLADAVLAAYASSPAEVVRWTPPVTRLALSFGLSRWEQDRDLGVDGDEHDEAFLRASMARL